MPDRKLSILLAEDDATLSMLLTDYLQSEGFEIKAYTDGQSALTAISNLSFDLYLLDVMLPKVDGFSLARSIRERNQEVPVIFITARSMKDDKLQGYDIGADDYITKPFDEEELLWKIRALTRRIPKEIDGNTPVSVFIGKYIFDFANQQLTIGNNTRRITEKESEILNYLSQNRNKVIRREEMVQELWGQKDYFLGRSLDVFITKIRKYLKDDPRLTIENVFGVGFVFNVPPGIHD